MESYYQIIADEYVAIIKEKGNNHILRPSIFGGEYKTRTELIKHWGLKDDDVEWFVLYGIDLKNGNQHHFEIDRGGNVPEDVTFEKYHF